MALEGTLKDFSLADIFQLIGLQRKTGILTLQSEIDTVTITFHQGMVVGAESVEKQLEDRLGRVLVKRAAITDENLERALETQKETLQRLGYVLVKYGFIPPEELRAALLQQIQQIIYRLFRWKEGYYHFRQEKTVHFDRENITPLSAETILMEGVRMIDEWPNIERAIESFRAVYVQTPKAERVIITDSEEETDLGSAKFQGGKEVINRQQAEVLELLDGKKDVQAVIDASRYLEFEVCKALASLIQRNLAAPLHKKQNEQPEIELAPANRMEKVRDIGRYVVSLAIAACLALAVYPMIKIINEGLNTARPLWDERLDKVGLDRVRYALVVYSMLHDGFPEDLNVLVTDNYLPPSLVLDSHGQRLSYTADKQGFVLRAAGKDRRPMTHLIVEVSVQSIPDESRFYHHLTVEESNGQR